MHGLIIHSTYETYENKTLLKFFGRLENGQTFLVINSFRPYLYIRKSDKGKFEKILSFSESIFPTSKKNSADEKRMKNFEGEETIKIEFETHPEMQEAYKKLRKEIPVYESDIRPNYKFLIEKKILGKIKIDGEYQPSEKIDRIYTEAEIVPSEKEISPKVVSIDIESDGKNLFCIGIVSDKYQKNFMITKKKLENTISCEDEEDCLTKFRNEIIKLDPDIITGWNVIDFDFVFLRDLFRKNKLKFDIGRDDNEPRFRIEKNFFRNSSIEIPGRQILDALNLIKDPFLKDSPFMKNADFKSLTLEDVSQELLKKGKLIKGKDRHIEIEKLYKSDSIEDLQQLADYNLMDCKLVLNILEKTKMIELALERSQLTGMPLDRLTASIAAFDSLYIREAHSKNLVSPTHDYKQKEERIRGGYVQSVKSGVYKNVLVLDFKSLYPSIIKTFNISPETLITGKKEKDFIEAPNGARFKKEQGILPEIISRLHTAREKSKKEKRPLSSHAIKIIMNSFFGVLASPNCRYFSLDMANAITHFGQFIIKLTAKEVEKMGYKVIYSDTDSIFVETKMEKQKANLLGIKIQKEINEFYKKYVKKFDRESYLELEFEKQYLSMIIPKIRGTEKAAKKRYAGLVEKNGKEELEITGLEAIRGDWTEAAQTFQIELLKKLFHEESVEKFIRDYIKKIKEGKIDDKLIYRKSIRKELKEYTKTTPPHVKAARKLDKLESNVIEYYITEGGPEPIQKLKHKIDYKHYLEKQIKPIANQILDVFGKTFEDVSETNKQSKLFN